MAASLEQQLAASRAALSAAKLGIKGLSDSVATTSRRLDSLIASTQAKTVEVRVASPLEVKDSPWGIAGVIVVPVAIAALTWFFSDRAARRGAIEGGRQTLNASLSAIREERRIERRDRRRMLTELLGDEVNGLTLRAGVWSSLVGEGRPVSARHIHQVELRMELYDRVILDLALFKRPLQRAIRDWYQNFKAMLWLANDIQAEEAETTFTSGLNDGLHGERRSELVQLLDRLAENGDRLERWIRTGEEPEAEVPRETRTGWGNRPIQSPQTPPDDTRRA